MKTSYALGRCEQKPTALRRESAVLWTMKKMEKLYQEFQCIFISGVFFSFSYSFLPINILPKSKNKYECYCDDLGFHLVSSYSPG